MDRPIHADDLGIESRLRRSRGRSSRCGVASARVTIAEQEELERAAKSKGQALSEWAREVLLREARRRDDDALFTEVVATRMLLNNILMPLANGQKITPEGFAMIMAKVRTEKRKAAREVMQQYTAAEQKEQ
jgi:hypothetical protein